jgi:hypothetical protein
MSEHVPPKIMKLESSSLSFDNKKTQFLASALLLSWLSVFAAKIIFLNPHELRRKYDDVFSTY